MKTSIKRCSVLLLTILLLVMSIAVPLHKASAAITYNNTFSADLNCSVNSSGRLSAQLKVTGISGKTTRIETELYIEKRFLLVFWNRVSIGYPNDVWTDAVNATNYNNTFNHDLSSTGTYRVTVTYTVYGTGGSADEITKTATVTY